jgi:putative transposase
MHLKHFDHDGRARFITFSTHKGIRVLTNDSFRKAVTDSIASVRQSHPFRLIAYVIMPEHVHLLILPPIDMCVGPAVGDIKRASARNIHRILAESANTLGSLLTVTRNGQEKRVVWKRRCYDHNCRSDQSVREKVRYCHYNPVKRGLVARPEDWKWSSCRWYRGERDVPLSIDVSFDYE